MRIMRVFARRTTYSGQYSLWVIRLVLCLGCASATYAGQNATKSFLNVAQDSSLAPHIEFVKSANADLVEIDRIVVTHEKTIDELDKADKANDVETVKSLLDDLIMVIDDGLKHGDSAAGKLERASTLVTTEEYKSYLSIKAQSVRTQVSAFKERRAAALLMRYNYGGTDKEREPRVKAEFRARNQKFLKLLAEAKELSSAADELARQHPDKIGLQFEAAKP